MSEYKNESGREVSRNRLGYLVIDPELSHNYTFSPDQERALREYFQYEHDTRLGRWRYTDSLVVYPVENHQPCNISRAVQVLDERDGKTYERYEGRVPGEDTTPEATEAAQAYFEAHPVPKPWHDAENGQLWLLRFEDSPARDVSTLVKEGRFVYNDRCCEGVAALDDPEIISGKRIWPEEE